MKSKKAVEEMLSFSDSNLATLYSEWSEDTYAAGWLSYGPPLFVEAVLKGSWTPRRSEPLADYEREGVAIIRKLFEAWLKEQND